MVIYKTQTAIKDGEEINESLLPTLFSAHQIIQFRSTAIVKTGVSYLNITYMYLNKLVGVLWEMWSTTQGTRLCGTI